MGPSDGRAASLLLRVFVIFQIFQIAMGSFSIVPRGPRELDSRRPFEDDPAFNETVLIKRDGKDTDWKRKKMTLDSGSCKGKGAYLARRMEQVKDMVVAGQKAIQLIRKNLGKPIPNWSYEARSKLDLFGAMYDEFDPVKHTESDVIGKRLHYIGGFLDKFHEGLWGDLIPITIFCNQDHEVFDHTEEKETKGGIVKMHWYKSSRFPNMGIFQSSCAREDSLYADVGAWDSLAQMVYMKPAGQDVMTICTGTFEKWGVRTLSGWADEDIGNFEFEELNYMLEDLAELTLFHEITHAEAYFGTDGVMEDYKLDGADDENPYLFPYLKKLGKQEGKVLDVKKNKALRNAESLTMFCAGVVIDQCNFRDGTCKAREAVDEEDMLDDMDDSSDSGDDC